MSLMGAGTIFNGFNITTAPTLLWGGTSINEVTQQKNRPTLLPSAIYFNLWDGQVDQTAEGTQPRARRYLAPLRGYVATRLMLRGKSQHDRHRQTASCLNRGSTTRVVWPEGLSRTRRVSVPDTTLILKTPRCSDW
jgi:hypothetical protein